MATPDATQAATQAALRTHKKAIEQLVAQNAQIIAALNGLQSRPRTIQEEIDSIPGRRIESTFGGEVSFSLSDLGQRAKPITIQVSQDGPFIWTHYPLVLWRPNQPANTPNLGRWRPVSSFPLPTQQITTDIIDLQYEIIDGGSQRTFQNTPRGPIFSRPDNIVPLPIPTMWSANAAIVFQPTYTALNWNSNPAPTEGILHVDFIGYRIANL